METTLQLLVRARTDLNGNRGRTSKNARFYCHVCLVLDHSLCFYLLESGAV
jgi:hypothetical protein